MMCYAFDNAYKDAQYWDSFFTSGITTKDEIRIDYTYARNNTVEIIRYFMDNLFQGTKAGLLKAQLYKYRLPITMTTLIFVFGFATLIVNLILLFYGSAKVRTSISCSLLMIAGTFCTFIDYNYITLIFPNVYLVNAIDLMAQASLCGWILVYLKNYIYKELHVIIATCGIAIWLVVGSFCMYLFAIRDMREYEFFYPATSIFICILLVFMGFIVFEYVRGHIKENALVLGSGAILFLFAVAEIIHFYLEEFFWIYVFEIGLFVFSTMQFVMLIQISKNNMRQVARVHELENALIQTNIATMISQIQPHFLYNALGTIRALCTRDPELARKAIDQFSLYLRANMDSLTEKECIPFQRELEHVQSYLYIEKLRFGDKLKIEYDLRETEFKCPALSLQTMVENAVKHGLGNKEEGGTLTILTRGSSTYYQIQIIDNGVGFDTTNQSHTGKGHVGIENTRKRISGMCGGEMAVKSTVGTGTIVTIRIPKGK